jgi:hypothetical protein
MIESAGSTSGSSPKPHRNRDDIFIEALSHDLKIGKHPQKTHPKKPLDIAKNAG